MAVPTGRRSQSGRQLGQEEGDAEGDRHGEDQRQHRGDQGAVDRDAGAEDLLHRVPFGRGAGSRGRRRGRPAGRRGTATTMMAPSRTSTSRPAARQAQREDRVAESTAGAAERRAMRRAPRHGRDRSPALAAGTSRRRRRWHGPAAAQRARPPRPACRPGLDLRRPGGADRVLHRGRAAGRSPAPWRVASPFAIGPVEELHHVRRARRVLRILRQQDEGGRDDRPALGAGLVDQVDGEVRRPPSRRCRPRPGSSPCVGFTNLPALLRNCAVVSLFWWRRRTRRSRWPPRVLLHRAGDAVIAAGARAGRPVDRGGGADLGLPLRATAER